jgi:hypothetical protein
MSHMATQTAWKMNALSTSALFSFANTCAYEPIFILIQVLDKAHTRP